MEQESQNISVFYLHYCWCCCLNNQMFHSCTLWFKITSPISEWRHDSSTPGYTW